MYFYCFYSVWFGIFIFNNCENSVSVRLLDSGLISLPAYQGVRGSNPDSPVGFFSSNYVIKIKLLSENKLIICALGNLYCQISREKFKPEPGFEPRTSKTLTWRSTTSVILVLLQSGRAPDFRSGGLRFESRFSFKFFS